MIFALIRFIFLYLISIYSLTQGLCSSDNKDIELLLETYVNNKKIPNIIYVIQRGGDLYISRKDLISWRLNLKSFSKKASIFGQEFYSLNTIQEIIYKIDMLKLRIDITVPSYFFEETIINGMLSSENKIATQVHNGAFLNYDMTAIYNTQKYQTYNEQNFNSYNILGVPEFGLFTSQGVGCTSFLASKNSKTSNILRLDSNWIYDIPEKMQRWVMGDTVTRTSDWGGAARIGGIQWSTNFLMQPNFVTFPLPDFKGITELPSTVDIFVNNALVLNKNIEGGPLRINNIPIVNGQGTATIVTRDLLGRETFIYLPYNTDIQLLKPGLIDFSFEMGALRKHYGLRNNKYKGFAITGTYNRGITNDWTLGSHTEIQDTQKNLGITTSNAIGNIGILSTSTAISIKDIDKKTGKLMKIKFQRTADPYSFGVSTTHATKNFRQIGLGKNEYMPFAQYQVFGGYNNQIYGSLSTTFTYQKRRSEQNVGLITTSYQKNIFNGLFFNIGMTRVLRPRKDTTIFLSITMDLKNIGNLSTYSSYNSKRKQQTVQLNKNLPLNEGYGYQAIVSNIKNQTKTDQIVDGTFYYQNTAGQYFARAATFPELNLYQGGVSGSIVFLNSKLYPSQKTFDSFALVQIPDFSNVRIYRDNQEVGTTNSEGDLLVSNLRSYNKHLFKAELKDLPLSAAIEQAEEPTIPPYKSGVIVKLAIKKSSALFFKIKTEDGEYVPAGAVIQIAPGEKVYLVGFDGEVYIEPIPNQNILKGKVKWSEQECYFNKKFSVNNESILRINDIVCKTK